MSIDAQARPAAAFALLGPALPGPASPAVPTRPGPVGPGKPRGPGAGSAAAWAQCMMHGPSAGCKIGPYNIHINSCDMMVCDVMWQVLKSTLRCEPHGLDLSIFVMILYYIV